MSGMIPEKRCVTCGIPLDAECFDVSGSVGMLLKKSFYTDVKAETEDNLLHNPIPKQGEQKILASFQLHPQYCGIITHFAQYTDLYASDNSLIHTPGFEWVITQNGKPVFPYTGLDMIINPWGYNCLQTSIRLDETPRSNLYSRTGQ